MLATPNLNGDYLSDACAAQVGGLGMAPGSNIGDGYGCFEATHGTAPKYADKDVINPGSVMLSGAMMFEFMGWPEVARLIEDGIAKSIEQKRVTYDLETIDAGRDEDFTSHLPRRLLKICSCRRAKEIQQVRNRENRLLSKLKEIARMRKKVTVVGGGFVGSTTAQRIVDLELADVVLTRHYGRNSGRAKGWTCWSPRPLRARIHT